jgi:hypothetical protein
LRDEIPSLRRRPIRPRDNRRGTSASCGHQRVESQLIVPNTMKTAIIASALLFQVSSISAFELPFKIPFELPFFKGPSPELFSLHRELIDIPSVTGNEHDVGVFLETYLKQRNYTVERIPSTLVEELTDQSRGGLLPGKYLRVHWRGQKSTVPAPLPRS